jgi:large subunit ribosomal protein L11
MAKKIKAIAKLNIQAGKANPAPPVGSVLGQHGVNIMDFCNAYNAQTKDKAGQVIPAEITIYEDRTFTFILKTPPTATLIKQTLGLDKGSANALTEHKGTLTKDQVRAIAEVKLPDLNTTDLEAAMKTVAGTAKQMGVKVEG